MATHTTAKNMFCKKQNKNTICHDQPSDWNYVISKKKRSRQNNVCYVSATAAVKRRSDEIPWWDKKPCYHDIKGDLCPVRYERDHRRVCFHMTNYTDRLTTQKKDGKPVCRYVIDGELFGCWLWDDCVHLETFSHPKICSDKCFIHPNCIVFFTDIIFQEVGLPVKDINNIIMEYAKDYFPGCDFCEKEVQYREQGRNICQDCYTIECCPGCGDVNGGGVCQPCRTDCFW